VWVTILTVSISMTIAILAAFSLSRMGFKGSQVLSTGVFLTYLVPPSLLFIPLFQILGWLGLINSTWSLADNRWLAYWLRGTNCKFTAAANGGVTPAAEMASCKEAGAGSW
jgi:ABC-type maltose transport system permease subunit